VERVAVIIPFFQREPGILKRAVCSALNQKTGALVKIIVVDDGSPVTALSDLDEFSSCMPDKICVIQQKNAGVGCARNTGLDRVEPDTDYVAFLDSDDVWTDSHIEHALWAFQHGYDFYFADHYQLDQATTAFKRAGRILVENHPRIHPSEPIHEYSGDMFDQIITGNIIGTSTVAYNFSKFSNLRFLPDFHNAGEDYDFWIRLTSLTQRIAFSSVPECRYGSGVNLFSNSGWGTDKYLHVAHDLLKYKKHILKNFKLTEAQKTLIVTAIRKHRIEYARGLLHNLIHNGSVERRIVWEQLELDPLTLLAVAVAPGITIYERFRRAS
jgi:succinoglycan biosynthesis protein ExoW